TLGVNTAPPRPAAMRSSIAPTASANVTRSTSIEPMATLSATFRLRARRCVASPATTSSLVLRRRAAVDIIRAPPERHSPLAEGHVKSLIRQLGPLLGNKLNVVYYLT